MMMIVKNDAAELRLKDILESKSTLNVYIKYMERK